ncbi:phosphate acyltransferase PlsX [Desulfogranum marinum]|uniref:phosphate acyltransferase PlsX n=1 Tax=Desulfogranum marinum TaxID=453220 RepID=UPI0019629881|nr:phosphate acyltransferase PlsX [Desulfogranum marinum]MBM9513889.1 phosphate acyltransferase PlsX [Desulfogranum marinum]
MRIALDAMGGDHGPEMLIQGAIAAVEEQKDLVVILVGPDSLHGQLAGAVTGKPGDIADRLKIQHAPEVVGMDESPVDAVRKKKNSTVMVGFDLIKSGNADAVVSAGNSGATLAAGVRKLGRLSGVSRPGIASFFPTLQRPVMLMDIGANVDCRPQHLYQFAVMASSCSSLLLNIRDPRIGLLSIGEETGKGNALVKETYDLLKHGPMNFVGNVEGRDVYKGDVDVIVCDGFVGNISLKISEGLAEAAMQMLKKEIMKTWRAKIGYLLIRKAFADFRKQVDYAEYGGAPLLGINGTGIICHGTSNATAIRNAIKVASDMVCNKVNNVIVQALRQ